jgi:NADH dehydrogenase/NADH:ubiquinone oxidoreductase subunit G
MAKLTIDGRKIEAKEGSTILQNIRTMNIDLPTLCQHDELSSFGACRLCTVEVKANGKWQLATSCNTPVTAGMQVMTASDRAKDARKLAASLLYYKYPNTKVIRDAAEKAGVAVSPSDAEGRDCILCGLCTRTCHEIVQACALTFEDRGLNRDMDEPGIRFESDACIGCGSCAYVCPTGFVRMETTGEKRIIWDKVFRMAACEVCGRYFAPEDQLAFISGKTGVLISRLRVCTSCR